MGSRAPGYRGPCVSFYPGYPIRRFSAIGSNERSMRVVAPMIAPFASGFFKPGDQNGCSISPMEPTGTLLISSIYGITARNASRLAQRLG